MLGLGIIQGVWILCHVPARSSGAAEGSGKRVAHYPGDVLLGALFPIHQYDVARDTCGAIQDEGVQPLESLMHTLDAINADPEILPGIHLGAVVMDTCDDGNEALRELLRLVKGFLENVHPNVTCSGDESPAALGGQVVGVIGGQSSTVSIQVANVLSMFQVPQVSYLSTSASLSDRHRYPYFFRTVPGDQTQAEVILKILKNFHWTYAGLLHSQSDYGSTGHAEIVRSAPSYGVCFVTGQPLSLSSPPSLYRSALGRLAGLANLTVVVVFAERQVTRKIMRRAKRMNLTTRFLWIGSDGWSSRKDFISGIEDILEGSLTVLPLFDHLPGFDDHFGSLLPRKDDSRDPWLYEYWENHFGCFLAGDANDSFACPPGLSLARSERYHQVPFLHSVRNAVYAFATALHDLQQCKCASLRGLCPPMRRIAGSELRDYLRNVTFRDSQGEFFHFQNGSEGLARYSVLLFQRTERDSFSWTVVGNYSEVSEDGVPLKLDRAKIRFRGDAAGGRIPTSSCSRSCGPGQIRISKDNDSCCWTCQYCLEHQIPSQTGCRNCPLGMVASVDRNICEFLPEEYVGYHDSLAILTASLATAGIVLTMVTMVVFFLFNRTPVIKASGRELSCLQLIGIFLSFLTVFFLLSRPSSLSCGVARFFAGFSYTLCYAAVFTKANRVARIFLREGDGAVTRPRFTDPVSQVVITLLLTFVEVAVQVAWMMLDPPRVTVVSTLSSRRVICSSLLDHSHFLALAYPFLLIVCCLVYAVKTRKCPLGFSESRHIAFSTYSVGVVWLAFVPLYLTSTKDLLRVVILAVSLSLSAMMQLFCLYFPKMYVVLFTPQKNTRQKVMARVHRRSSVK